MLFDIYEKIQYTIGDKTLTLADIFKSISFKNVETSNAFYDYYIQDGETPELVSVKIYGTTSYSWLILLCNNILNLKDWFVSSTEFERTREVNYGGNAFYISALPDLKPGDVMVKVTATGPDGFATGITANIYQQIVSFDPFLRKIRGICGAGTLDIGNDVLFARKLDNGNIVPLQFSNQDEIPTPTDYTSIIYKEQYGNSLDYFYTNENIVLNPYKKGITGNSIPAYTTYTDPGSSFDNFALTILYKYGACGGVPITNVNKKAINTEVYEDYLKKQKIRILKPEYLAPVVRLIRDSIKSDEVGNTFKIEI